MLTIIASLYVLIPAFVALACAAAASLFAVPARTLTDRADRAALTEARALLAQADQCERDAAAVQAYFTRYTARSTDGYPVVGIDVLGHWAVARVEPSPFVVATRERAARIVTSAVMSDTH